MEPSSARRRVILLVAALSLFLLVVGERSSAYVPKDKVEKYALLVVGSLDTNAKLHPNLDPVDVNAAIMTVAKIYKTLKGCGFKDSRIFILCGSGRVQPDWSDKQYAKQLAKIRKYHFSGRYSNSASPRSITLFLSKLKEKVDENDYFIFYLITHGNPKGTVQLHSGATWSSPQMQEGLGGFRSKTNLFLFDVCHSGSILDRTSFPNAVTFATTGAGTPGWVDRKFSNCANFLKNKIDKKLDRDKDGIIDYQEAFEETKKQAAKYEPNLLEYIKTKYRPPRSLPRGIAARMSLTPEIEVGENYVRVNLFSSEEKETDKKKKKVRKRRVRRDPGERLFKKAQKADEEKRYAEALEFYKRVASLAKQSKFSEAAKKRIEELESDNSLAETIKQQKQERVAKSNLDMARSYVLSHAYEKAAEYCNKVIEENPGTEFEKQARELLIAMAEAKEDEE